MFYFLGQGLAIIMVVIVSSYVTGWAARWLESHGKGRYAVSICTVIFLGCLIELSWIISLL